MIPAPILTTNGDMLSRMDLLPPGIMGAPPSPERSAPPAPRSVPSQMPTQMATHHGEQPRSNLSEEDIGRALSAIVRHRAFIRNIMVRCDGFMKLSEVCQEVGVSQDVGEEVARISRRHGRPRFELQVDEGVTWIRATSKVTMFDSKVEPTASIGERDKERVTLQDDKALALIAELKSENAALLEKVKQLEAQLGRQQLAAPVPAHPIPPRPRPPLPQSQSPQVLHEAVGRQQPAPPVPAPIIPRPLSPSKPDHEPREALHGVDAVQGSGSLLEPALPLRWLSSSSSGSSQRSTASGGRSTSSLVPDPPRPPLPPDEMPGVALEAVGGSRSASRSCASRSSSTSANSLRQTQPQEPVPQPPADVQQPEAPPSDSPKYLLGCRVVALHVAQDESEIGVSPGEDLEWCIHTTYPGWLYIEKKATGARGYVPEECLQPEAADDVVDV